MKTYTVIRSYGDLVIDGAMQTYMTSVEASSPSEAADLAAEEMDDDSGFVIAVIEGDHVDVYPHNNP